MIDRVIIHRGTYHDSAFLMRVARDLKADRAVAEAVVLMGTPMNLALLREAGFGDAELASATPLDMVVALRAPEAPHLDAAEVKLAELLAGGSESGPGGPNAAAAGRPHDRSLAEALAAHPDASLISVSVPGAYAAYVTKRAIEGGRHVFLFSNNVELADEIALKKRARELGLLVMGPDCGTAIIGGVGLGFANRVPRGPIGLVGASGTGLQEVSCALAHFGTGVSQAIGTGSRDLSADVGAIMTLFGLELLAADAATKVIALVAKHPAESVAARVHEVLEKLGKPVVVRYLGTRPRPSTKNVHYATDLDAAARAAVALLRGEAPPDPTALAAHMRQHAEELRQARFGSPSGSAAAQTHNAGRIVGLFGGGSLASEAKLILSSYGLEASTPERPLPLTGPVEEDGHLVIDTGEDFYTLGKPHPMVDQTVRCALLTKAAADPAVSHILLDLVLGDGSHHDPAPELAAALAEGRARRGQAPLWVITSICGTDADRQNAAEQRAVLTKAGVAVTDSAAAAAHLCACLYGEGSRGH